MRLGAHRNHVTTERNGVFLVVGNQQERNIQPALQGVDLVAHKTPETRIKGGKRFIKQQRCGLTDRRTRHGDTLSLPARELVWIVVCDVLEVHACQPVFHSRLPSVTRHREGALRQAEANVLPYIQMGEQGVVLEHHAESALMRRDVDAGICVEQGATGQPDMPSIWPHGASDALHAMLRVNGVAPALSDLTTRMSIRALERVFIDERPGAWWIDGSPRAARTG
jgi:hypothetical protein